MEIQYNKWFELRIFHQYFNDAKISVNLLPTQESTIIMDRNKVLMRKNGNLFEFYVGKDSNDIDQGPPIENIELEIFSDDPYFLNYTDLLSLNTEEYYLFRNILNNPELKMEKANSVNLAQQLKENSIGIIQINTKDLQTERLTLSFEARQVFFEYQVIIPAHNNWDIIDLKVHSSEHEEYYGPIERSINGGQKAQVFISPKALPLILNHDKHPQLNLRYKHSSSVLKELKIPLPNVSHENLHYKDNDRLVSSAIIYV